jgi:hypothetical protein
MDMNEQIHNLSSKWMTTRQVCAYVHKHENWVLLHKHELGSSKRAGTLLFKRSAIVEFIDADYFRIGEDSGNPNPSKRKQTQLLITFNPCRNVGGFCFIRNP